MRQVGTTSTTRWSKGNLKPWRIQGKQPSPAGAGYQGPREPPLSARHCQAPRPTAEQDYVINDCISPDSFSFSSNLACLPS